MILGLLMMMIGEGHAVWKSNEYVYAPWSLKKDHHFESKDKDCKCIQDSRPAFATSTFIFLECDPEPDEQKKKRYRC